MKRRLKHWFPPKIRGRTHQIVTKRPFLPYLFPRMGKDRAAGGNRQLQICDNLSVSFADSSPGRGAKECAPPEVLKSRRRPFSQPAAASSPGRGALGRKSPPRGRARASFYCFSLVLSAKYSFVSFATTPERAKRAMKFGMAMRPLKVSAMSHTTSSEATAPTTTMMMNRT